MADQTLARLKVLIDANMKPYREGMQKVSNITKSTTDTINSHMGRIKGVIAGALSVTAIVAFSKSCIELGSDLAEVQNVVDVTFGSMSDKVDQFAKNALTAYGLSETSAKQFTSTMGAMLKSMGLSTQQAFDMGTSLTALSADMASFYNLDAKTAFEKIRSGISGETEKSGDEDPYLDAINAMLAERGMKTAYRIKKITVSGLTHLPASAADLSDRAAEDLKKQAEDFISARTAEIYDSYAHVSVSSTDCIGNYFLKGDGETGTDNILYLVYKVTQNFQPLDSQGSVTASGDITAYVLIEYDDLHLDADNHIASMRGPIYYQGGSFRQDFDRNDGNGRDARNITGFRDLQEIKDSVLVPAEEFYKVEDNTEE